MDEDSSTNTYITQNGKEAKLYPGFNVKLVIDSNTNQKRLRIESNSNTLRQGNVYIPDNVTNVRILRMDGILYYSFDRGKFIKLNSFKNYTDTCNTFDAPVIFGAGLDENGNFRRFFKGIISDASIRFIEGATIDNYNPPLKTVYAHEGPIQFVPDKNGNPSKMIDVETGQEITDIYGNTDMIYTGISLFKDSASLDKEVEISFVIDEIPSGNKGQDAIVNAKYEKKGVNGVDYPGFVYRLTSNKSAIELTARGYTSGSGASNSVSSLTPANAGDPGHKVTISVRSRQVFISIDDGAEKMAYDFTNFNSFFDVPITIGGSLNNEGVTNKPFRGFKGTLSNIVVKVGD